MRSKPAKAARVNILNTIIRAGVDGITQSELVSSTGYHRDTINVETHALVSSSKITRERTGREVRYFFTAKALESLKDKSFLYPFYASRNILSRFVTVPLTGNVGGEQIQNDSPFVFYDSAKDRKSAFDIFDFSARLGAVIMFLILIAIDAINRAEKENPGVSSAEKDMLAEQSLRKSIESLVPKELLTQFVAWFNAYEEQYAMDNRLRVDLRKEPSLYQFDDTVLDQLRKSLFSAFPAFGSHFSGIEKEIDDYIDRTKMLLMQRQCEHKFDSILGADKVLRQRCSLCGFEQSRVFNKR